MPGPLVEGCTPHRGDSVGYTGTARRHGGRPAERISRSIRGTRSGPEDLSTEVWGTCLRQWNTGLPRRYASNAIPGRSALPTAEDTPPSCAQQGRRGAGWSRAPWGTRGDLHRCSCPAMRRDKHDDARRRLGHTAGIASRRATPRGVLGPHPRDATRLRQTQPHEGRTTRTGVCLGAAPCRAQSQQQGAPRGAAKILPIPPHP